MEVGFDGEERMRSSCGQARRDRNRMDGRDRRQTQLRSHSAAVPADKTQETAGYLQTRVNPKVILTINYNIMMS